jgi:aldehyde dehydrogenase (NAD+)
VNELHVRNPRTGTNDYAFTPPTRDELKGQAGRLREMQRPWESRPVEARADTLRAWAAQIRDHRAGIVDALIADTGRRIESELEVDAILGSIERWCTNAPALLAEPDPRPGSIPFVSVGQGMRPFPLVGVISPWNFPLLLSLIDAIPALLAGCAVIVKPSEIAPRFIEPVARAIPDDLPLAYVAGAGETGSSIVGLVDAVCFTGSVTTGRTVGEQAARRFIPAFLELGGKDPAVVLASADVDRASSAILWGGTANAGQSCLSIERVYVERALYEPFVEALADKARALRLAAPTVEDGEIGPIIAHKQIAVIADHLADASAKGAKARTGGELETIKGGTYLRPTVLTGVDHTMKVMAEETFGPILPVMSFDGTDEGVALANDTTFGLSAAVFGEPDEALAVARRMNAGGISINDAALTALVYDGEKNSFNLSGLGGSRMGPAALRRFGRRQAYLVASAGAPDPWWYPQLRG